MLAGKALKALAGLCTCGSSGVHGKRLRIKNPELFIKLFCDLTRKLNQVAAVQFAIGPVEPAHKQMKRFIHSIYNQGFILSFFFLN